MIGEARNPQFSVGGQKGGVLLTFSRVIDYGGGRKRFCKEGLQAGEKRRAYQHKHTAAARKCEISARCRTAHRSIARIPRGTGHRTVRHNNLSRAIIADVSSGDGVGQRTVFLCVCILKGKSDARTPPTQTTVMIGRKDEKPMRWWCHGMRSHILKTEGKAVGCSIAFFGCCKAYDGRRFPKLQKGRSYHCSPKV